MLKLKEIGLLTSLFLIVIIFLQMPEENAGLTNFAARSSFLGSSNTVRWILNFIVTIGVLIYFATAIALNFNNH